MSFSLYQQQQQQQDHERKCRSDLAQANTYAMTSVRSMKLDELYNDIAEVLEKERRHIFALDDQIDITENLIALTRQERLMDQKIYDETMTKYTAELEATEKKIMSLLSTLKAKASTIPKTDEDKKEILIYKNALQSPDNEDDNCDELDCSTSSRRAQSQRPGKTPAYALSKQAQLCRNVHVLTIHSNQLFLFAQQAKETVRVLERELRNQAERIYTTQIHLLNECINIETEIETMKTSFLSYFATFYCRLNRINSNDVKEESTTVPGEVELNVEVEEFVGNHRSSPIAKEGSVNQPSVDAFADTEDMVEEILISDVEVNPATKNGSVSSTTVSTSEISTDDEEVIIKDEEELLDCESINLVEENEEYLGETDDECDDDDSRSCNDESSCDVSYSDERSDTYNPSEDLEDESLSQHEQAIVTKQSTWSVSKVNKFFSRLSFSRRSEEENEIPSN